MSESTGTAAPTDAGNADALAKAAAKKAAKESEKAAKLASATD